jgi:hypothetical protein
MSNKAFLSFVKFSRVFFTAAIFYLIQTAVPVNAEDWLESKGEHFIVYYKNDDKFAKDVLDKSEVYYRNIASGIGYPRYSDFWLWDKRAKIYIYPDHKAFLRATGQPAWSHGEADYKEKKISSYVWSRGFVESLLPHEIAHLVFRDFIGFEGQVPLWIDEGVAQWAEEAKREHLKSLARELFKNDLLMTIKELMNTNLKYIKLKDVVYMRAVITKGGEDGVAFMTGEKLVDNYYIEGFSLVNFLIEKYGAERFARFCRELRDGSMLEGALKSVYPSEIGSFKDLEKAWRLYLMSEDK